MVYACIKKELKPYETDIRELCMAFFNSQKVVCVDENADFGGNSKERVNDKLSASEDIIIKDYYNGSFEGKRIEVKSEVKRQLYNYLSNMTGKKLLWGTLTGIRPVNIVTGILESNKGSLTSEKNHEERSIKDVMGLSPITEIGSNIYKENELIKKYLKEEYYISDEKAFELIRIGRNEEKILERPEIRDYKNSYSVYVGVPFCKSTCLYCSFTSFNIDKFGKYVDKYLETLEKEFSCRVGNIEGVSHSSPIREGSQSSLIREGSQSSLIREDSHSSPIQNSHISFVGASFTSANINVYKLQPLTLYIGGGTPTSLNEDQFERLLTIVDKYVDKSKCIEYTVEAGRADTITREKLIIMKKHGVNRISINPQSFNQKTLDIIGRKHTVKDVVEKFKLARSLGFDNINMDIILGLPNEHLIDVLKTLNGVRKLKPDSFTVHSLALKRAARLNFEFAEWTKNHYLAGVGKTGLAELASTKSLFQAEGKREIDKMFWWSEKLADFLKLKPYYLYRQKNIAGNLENVGYAKEGKECIYNIMMMSERHSVYGFGTATTKEVFYETNGKRIESEEGYKSVMDYCERVGV